MTSKQQLKQILAEGYESVSRSGVRAFTVEALAKRLAMSKKTIYISIREKSSFIILAILTLLTLLFSPFMIRSELFLGNVRSLFPRESVGVAPASRTELN